MKNKVPIPTLERLATYLRLLGDLQQSAIETVSSAVVESHTDINAAQFRKDLSYFGEFGKPGVGYNVADLQARIEHILQIDNEQPVILVGVGNLGSALVGYPGLTEHHYNLVAAFDADPERIGRQIRNVNVYAAAELSAVNARLGARIAILAVPAAAAQAVADQLCASGIRAILNFAPVVLRVPRDIVLRNVSFLQELAVLSYHLSSEEGAAGPLSE